MKDTPIVRYDEIDFEKLSKKFAVLPRPRGNQGKKDTKWYWMDLVCAFDIETTYLSEIDRSIMYIWQFQLDEYYTIIGRTWEEYIKFLSKLYHYIPDDCRLYIGVHNLSYEWHYLRGIYKFNNNEVFAIKKRKILHCSMMNKKYQYFCTYKHSNMSLEKYTEKMECEHAKLVGSFDYSKRRYPWTELTDSELKYCVHDVLGLVEAIKHDLIKGGDTLYTFPLTSTGYVRRDVRSALMRSRYRVQDILPDYHIYELLEEAMRGGNTHANRFYVGRIIENVKSADRKSSYPEVIENYRYPMSKWEKVESPDMENFLHQSKVRNKAVLMRVKIWGMQLKEYWWPVPYIPKSKCRHLVKITDKNGEEHVPIIDNGRVLEAPYLEITITDIDFNIIISEYRWDAFEIEEMYTARYAFLPQAVRDRCRKYFEDKSKLDGIKSEKYYYNKSKELLNAIYGMFAQAVIQNDLIFENNEFKENDKMTRKERYEEQKEKVFLSYAWGVWVTAYARLELEKGIRLAGANTLYVDTDSVKYIDNGSIDFTTYNKEKIALSTKNKAYADSPKKGRLYLGIYEQDGEYDKFATWGSKKYCSVKDGELSLTISGVSKELGAKELEDNGGIERFIKNDFTFIKAGGLEARYYDGGSDFDYEVEHGKFVHISACCSLVPSTYKMGITPEYERLLKGLKFVQ